ncbi:hypothetical protein ACIRD3_08730 [Kitasatospora sp. NPDC093550]|uniref:hypothetical protein n=1 Tax=Kitasatospora sp. NPDC093550 TaxID=3364089 RepID=UPI00382FC335
MTGLRNLITGLPDAFAAAPRPARVEGCPCCTSPAGPDALLRTPRERLGPEELAHYAGAVLDTVGSPADLRYFAPRILQLLLTGELACPELESFCLKLARASWQDWPEAPYLRRLFHALWQDVLGDGEEWWDAEAVLCAVAAADPATVEPALAEWARLATPTAVERLHEFLLHSGTEPRNAFWDRRAPGYRAFTDWLCDPVLLAAVEEAVHRTENPAHLEQLFTVHAVLETQRHRPAR